jgi:predicted anti-sigma-YlaC factor YlaD
MIMANYNHPPFEDWILERKTLDSGQELALQEHLQSCESCRRFAESWREVEFRLKGQTLISPEQGFTHRWQTRLAQERARQQTRQTYVFLGATLGGAVVLLVAMGILLVPVLRSPYPFLLALAYQITTTISFIGEVALLVGALFETMLRVVPPSVWIGLTVAAGVLIALWLVIFRRLIYKRRILV